jgi:hypothetical protein
MTEADWGRSKGPVRMLRFLSSAGKADDRKCRLSASPPPPLLLARLTLEHSEAKNPWISRGFYISQRPVCPLEPLLAGVVGCSRLAPLRRRQALRHVVAGVADLTQTYTHYGRCATSSLTTLLHGHTSTNRS